MYNLNQDERGIPICSTCGNVRSTGMHSVCSICDSDISSLIFVKRNDDNNTKSWKIWWMVEKPDQIMINKYYLDCLTWQEVDLLRQNNRLITKEIIAFELK